MLEEFFPEGIIVKLNAPTKLTLTRRIPFKLRVPPLLNLTQRIPRPLSIIPQSNQTLRRASERSDDKLELRRDERSVYD